MRDDIIEKQQNVEDTRNININFGKLQPLLDDEDVTEVAYNGRDVWVIYRNKPKQKVMDLNVTPEDIKRICNQASAKMNKPFNQANVLLDAETDEFRLAAINDEVAPGGICLSIRKTPARMVLTEQMLYDQGYMDEKIYNLLKCLVKAGANMVICGEVNTGKTELIKFLSSSFPENARLITIEDTLELRLEVLFPERDVFPLKTGVKMTNRDAIRACLRQSPAAILLAEMRGDEVLDVIETASTGHTIITTIHAESAHQIPDRAITMVREGRPDNLKDLVYSNIQIGIFLRKKETEDGIHRYIAEIVEFYKDGEKYITNELFVKRKDYTGKDIVVQNPVSENLMSKITLIDGLYDELDEEWKTKK